MKIKTTNLTGPALAWVVAKLENVPVTYELEVCWSTRNHPQYDGGVIYAPYLDWAQGGPIIEREQISFTYHADDPGVVAYIGIEIVGGDILNWRAQKLGPTPLIAAMRCYVASKLGDEVEVPDEIRNVIPYRKRQAS